MDFRYRLMRFMSGRNGPDELFFAFFLISVILSVINIFVRSVILQLAVYALMIYALFRLFRETPKNGAWKTRTLLKNCGLQKGKRSFTSAAKTINATFIKPVHPARRF